MPIRKELWYREAFLGIQDPQGTEEDFMTLRVKGPSPKYEENHPYMEEKDDDYRPRKRSGKESPEGLGEAQTDTLDLSSRQNAYLAEYARQNPGLWEHVVSQGRAVHIEDIPVSPRLARMIWEHVSRQR